MSTPLRSQYLEIKRRHPGLILLFQVGDFYETFDEDARVLARDLGVTLTRKWFGKDDVHPLAGVPVRSLESHLQKLIQMGHRVAVCDQVTLPGKGLVEREVVRIITPGTVMEPGLLRGRESNYLACLLLSGRAIGLSYADVSTGEFRTTELDLSQALAELHRIGPAELLVQKGLDFSRLEPTALSQPRPGAVTEISEAQADLSAARQALLDHFGVLSLQAYGCENLPLSTGAAGALLLYLRDTQPDALLNLTSLSSYQADRFLLLDQQTLGDLEVFGSWQGNAGPERHTSLVAAIDLTATTLGGRLLRRWLRQPLLDLPELRGRHDAIEWLLSREPLRARLRQSLNEVLDVERLLGRIRRRLAVPAEVQGLSQSLRAAAEVRASLVHHAAPAFFLDPLSPCDDLIGLIGQVLDQAAIRAGHSRELDQLRDALTGGRRFLAELEKRERQRTGIRSLKVSFNKVYGYYIEVTKPNLRLVPGDYLRKQSLAHAERFFTLELKEHESFIANARERIAELEASLYQQLCEQIGSHHERLCRLAGGLAYIDLCSALAEGAARFGYVRPELVDCEHDLSGLTITAGRHPIVEQLLPAGRFVPNDTVLCPQAPDGTQIMLLTAPNMAGKSVYLRQVALICLLAQAGCFVPATAARLPLLDRIFTRIGLADHTTRGHSSFMGEMVETAHILHHATPRSLVLLDEIGRGTATADGVSIARAVLEYLHNHPRVRALTLFATHYHELTACADYLPRVHNFHLSVREHDGRVEYLHQVKPGAAERSFGLHVAQLAGMPRPVLRRAQELLLEHQSAAQIPPAAPVSGLKPPWLRALLDLDINELSPVAALTQLYQLQQQARGPAEAAPAEPEHRLLPLQVKEGK